MTLRTPVARLRIVNASNTVAKVQVSIPAGDVLEVSETLARQLIDARVGVREVSATADSPAEDAVVDDAAVETAVQPKPRRRRGAQP